MKMKSMISCVPQRRHLSYTSLFTRSVLVFIITVSLFLCSASTSDHVCSSNPDDPNNICQNNHHQQASSTSSRGPDRPPIGTLRPSDLPEPVVFTAFTQNTTVTIPNSHRQQKIATGTVTQINNVKNPNTQNNVMVDFAVLPQAVNRSSIEKILQLLRSYNDWDDDPDTVDGMPTYEMFVHSPELYPESSSSSEKTMKHRDTDPQFLPKRKQLREQLTNIMKPYLDEIITPMVHQRYPKACTSKGPNRFCTPCYSLIRKYQYGQRQSHATHHDGHAIVTVVVSLSDYNINYRGGLYVSTGYGQHEFMALNRGDAIMHQSSLLHGVQVYDLKDSPTRTERWSWILWYKDSPKCQDYGYEWFEECANQGDALCQQLHSTKIGSKPGMTESETSQAVLNLNIQAALGGAGMAAVKVARAYLQQLPSSLSYDPQQAQNYYQLAIQSHNPDGHYGMAQMLLMSVLMDSNTGNLSPQQQQQAWNDPRIIQAIEHLESAAYLGHAFAKFNLGMVHTYGYGNGIIDATLAGQWFEACGLPEGYYVAAQEAQAVGNTNRYQEMIQHAQIMGFFAQWRQLARQSTGSGGATGVDLNLPWPPAKDGRQPPKF